jgi:hypothetical protein
MPDGIVQFQPEQTDSGSTTFPGYVSPDGGFMIIAVTDTTGVSLLFASRSGHSSNPSNLSGHYALNSAAATYPKVVLSDKGQWGSYVPAIGNGHVAIQGSHFSATETYEAMTSQTTCVLASGGCAATSDLGSVSSGPFASEGRVRRLPAGLIRFDGGAEAGEALQPDAADFRGIGFATDNGQAVTLIHNAAGSGRQEIDFLTREGTPGAANILGTYNAVALEEFFDSEASARNAFVFGPISFDAQGQWEFLGTDSASKRLECGGTQCPGATISSRTVAGGAGGGYSFDSKGTLSVIGVAGDNTPRSFVGNVSADGSLIVLRRVGDGTCSFDCMGTQEFRSVIIAVRR